MARKCPKYSPEFKWEAVRRLLAGESATALANELGVRRKFLYAWRNKLQPAAKPKQTLDTRDRRIAELEKQLTEQRVLLGRQSEELDFFDAALRAIKGAPRPNASASATRCTPPSKE